jgi:hypothetical protein
MRKFLFVTAVISCFCAPAIASDTIYTSRSAFEAALGAFQVETFTGNVLHLAGLSFVSSAGSMGSNVFNDRVVNGGDSTTWTFGAPTFGFGGDWDLTPGGAGQGIEFFKDSTTLVTSQVPKSYSGQFWGFISTTSFTTLRYDGGTQGGFAETHNMDNLTISAVPEPETYAMLMAGLGLLGTVVRRRKSSQA